MPQQHIINQDHGFGYEFTARDFDLQYWMASPGSLALAGGRNASCRFELNGRQLVLREYRRGGMMAALLHDRYLWTGMDNSRPLLESRVVDYAMQNNLPVAPIVAYYIERKGIFYRAAIISSYIENRGTLANVLNREVFPEHDWQRLGRLIRNMHRSGIDHADLNANNILVNKHNQLYLIDFDKARIHQKDGSWQQDNLDRLLRSIRKIQGQQHALTEDFHFGEQYWQALLSGYR